MNKKIVYIGLDVDDTQYHGAALNKATGELFHFKCRPTLKGLSGQLTKVGKQFPRHVLQVVYEASYIGFTLQRDLTDKGIHCEVVAPSSILRQGGRAVKTDRIDAAQLAQFYASDLLTIVQAPDLEVEQDRDLLRSRQRLMHQREQVRRHLQAILRRNGLHYQFIFVHSLTRARSSPCHEVFSSVLADLALCLWIRPSEKRQNGRWRSGWRCEVRQGGG